MRIRHFIQLWLAIMCLLVTLLASVLFQAPASAQGKNDVTAITELVEAMSQAIAAQDRDTYLTYVDLSDPVFAREHMYWIEDWSENVPATKFAMRVSDIEVEGAEATAELTIEWWQQDVGNRRAALPVRFVRAEGGAWRFAGERWITYEIEHFRVHAVPDREANAQALTEILPDLYDYTTTSFNYEPEGVIEIKLYASREALGAIVALSLPPFRGWNEPGESLRMFVEAGEIPSSVTLVHEFAHFITFDMAGTSRGHYPWWVMEGIADYTASEYRGAGWAAERLARVRDWNATGMLADWGAMHDFETTPVELWQFVYPQGYVFVRFLAETYGEDLLNEWLWAMAGELEVEDATAAVYDMPFAEIDQAFRVWLDG